ncbi:MAG: DUF3592 domain-containing protein [Colwellia sp.]|nr:DUF3592 domain-containing protein [Colwellia sp.]
MTITNKEIKKKRKILYTIMFFILCFVLISTNLVFKSLYGVYKSSDWITVDAVLLHAHIGERYSQNGNTKTVSYTPKIRYQYNLGGRIYNDTKVSWTEKYNNSDMLSRARYFVSQFNAGKSIRIYVDPDNHADAVVYKNINWSRFSGIIIACLISWGLLVSCVYIFITKLKYL